MEKGRESGTSPAAYPITLNTLGLMRARKEQQRQQAQDEQA